MEVGVEDRGEEGVEELPRRSGGRNGAAGEKGGKGKEQGQKEKKRQKEVLLQ